MAQLKYKEASDLRAGDFTTYHKYGAHTLLWWKDRVMMFYSIYFSSNKF